MKFFDFQPSKLKTLFKKFKFSKEGYQFSVPYVDNAIFQPSKMKEV